MRRLLAPTVLAVAVLAAMALPAGAHHSSPLHDAKGAPCSEIIGGSVAFNGILASARMELAAASCSDHTYTFFATPTAPGVGPVGPTEQQSQAGDGNTVLEFQIAVEAPEVCVSVETVKKNGQVSDRWPDEPGTCEKLPPDIDPGGKPMG